jgi:hypothetical protein
MLRMTFEFHETLFQSLNAARLCKQLALPVHRVLILEPPLWRNVWYDIGDAIVSKYPFFQFFRDGSVLAIDANWLTASMVKLLHEDELVTIATMREAIAQDELDKLFDIYDKSRKGAMQ